MLNQNQDEVNRIKECVTKLIWKVANVLSQENSLMAFECILSGSTKENTKCYAPDELDFVCLFINVFGLVFEGNFIWCSESNPWRRFSSKDGYLDQRLLAQAFYDLFMTTIISHFDEIEAELDQLCISRYPMQRMDKISQLKFRMEW